MSAASDADPWLWLEAVDSERALAWARARNAESRAVLTAEPGFGALRDRLRAMLDAPGRIPQVTRRGPWLYNLWQDAAQPRGLWRRTTMASFAQPAPAWEPLLDLDALGRAEGENWVWGGATVLGPAYRHALVHLSRGGADATVVREFDLASRRFVDDGFGLPEAKSRVTWGEDTDTVYVGTDFGAGSLTDSGYPRLVKRWRRGQPLASAVTVFEGEPGDVAVSISVDRTPGFERTLLHRAVDFYRSRQWLLQGDRLVPLAKPDDASVSFWRTHVLLELRSDWAADGQTWPGGSLLAADADAFLAGRARWLPLFTPTPTCSLSGLAATRSRIVLTLLDNVASRIETVLPGADGWTRARVEAPHPGTLDVQALHDPLLPDDPLAEQLLVHYTDFLTPDSLRLTGTDGAAMTVLKSLPAHFDAAGLRAEQRFATSRDGTRVPYFVVWPRDGSPGQDRPTLLNGYGGFEVARQPTYLGGIGIGWLERGGVFVLANLRGGGEFGPAWHQAAVKERKQNSYDDFIAVAEDLVAAGITRPERLGIMGGSNGGLLVGAVMVQRPALFGAVVCQVPLLDMKRYHRLLAGASWMAEYGDPDDPDDWAFIARYSPYQNLRAGQPLPALLLTTSTRDDRVHPGHARKTAARLYELGYRAPAADAPRRGDVYYHENIEGGHGGAADNAQRADKLALEFAFLWRHLGAPGAPADR
jgi:prolyl oligopeptidase